MPARTLPFIAFFATALAWADPAPTPAPAKPERIRIVTGSHLPQPTGVESIHVATCGTVDYRLVVSPGKQTVVLSASSLADTDLSQTAVGARLLEQDILVQVEFNCPMNALNIFIKGVKLTDLGAPAGFKGHVSVGTDGVVGKGTLKAEPVEELATPRQSVTRIPARPPGD